MNELVPVWHRNLWKRPTTRGKLVSMKFCQNSVLVCLGGLSWSVLILSCGPVWFCPGMNSVLMSSSQSWWQKIHKLTESSNFLHLRFWIAFIWNLNLNMKPLVKSQTLKKQQHCWAFVINKRLPIANKWQAAPICILPSGKKEREGRVREGTEKWRGTLGAWGAFFYFFEFFFSFLMFFWRFWKETNLYFSLLPIPVNKGKIFLLSLSTRKWNQPLIDNEKITMQGGTERSLCPPREAATSSPR